LAERIIEYREAIGKFRNAKDLVKVKGIGPKNVQRILAQIEFD
jgi:competence ComEA-like helix-hairpin-helix protein